MSLDFLKGPGNLSLDLMRLGGFSAFILYPMPFVWNAIAHNMVPDPASFGTGYGAVIAAAGAAICAKDIGVAKANATSSDANS